MSVKEQNGTGDAESTASKQPRPMSRRALLKGSAKAMPALLTLQSGAALARSSNLISATSSNPTDAYGRTLCLDVNSVSPADGDWRVFDLGEPAYGRVSAIRERDYRRLPSGRSDRISEAQMCQRGGTYYYYNRYGGSSYWGRWRKVKVKQGVLVSATALSSFAGSVVVNDL